MEVDAPAEAPASQPANLDQEEAVEVPSYTIYVHNLNERVKLKVLKTTLRNLFRHFGTVVDVVAHRNVRMRGQAFVAMDSIDAASKAVKEAQRFPLYGRPMQLEFAKTRADALVKKMTPDELEQHKKERLERKKMTRYSNPVTKKLRARKQAAKKGISATGAAPVVPAPAKRQDQVPDEYLPPNKILFIQNLPETATKEGLEKLFGQYPYFFEVRTIPGRKTIAFVEYADENASSIARDALHGTELDGSKLKITFAKK